MPEENIPVPWQDFLKPEEKLLLVTADRSLRRKLSCRCCCRRLASNPMRIAKKAASGKIWRAANRQKTRAHAQKSRQKMKTNPKRLAKRAAWRAAWRKTPAQKLRAKRWRRARIKTRGTPQYFKALANSRRRFHRIKPEDASQHRQRWDVIDDLKVLEAKKTIYELALELGRTVAAVNGRRYKLKKEEISYA